VLLLAQGDAALAFSHLGLLALCGIKAEALEVLNEDWESACTVEKCAGCFAAVRARGSD
jgi:hypothetical protein